MGVLSWETGDVELRGEVQRAGKEEGRAEMQKGIGMRQRLDAGR